MQTGEIIAYNKNNGEGIIFINESYSLMQLDSQKWIDKNKKPKKKMKVTIDERGEINYMKEETLDFNYEMEDIQGDNSSNAVNERGFQYLLVFTLVIVGASIVSSFFYFSPEFIFLSLGLESVHPFVAGVWIFIMVASILLATGLVFSDD